MRFFIPGPLGSESTHALSDGDSRHFAQVLRGTGGDTVELFNGEGTVASAVVEMVSKRAVTVRVTGSKNLPPASRITLAFGLCKGTALDFIIHRCTELGLQSFQPLITQHSSTASGWNPERWSRVVIEVAKQCQAVWLPKLHTPISLAEWLAAQDHSRSLVFCDEADRSGKPALAAEGIDLLIGAEGGWSDAERLAIKEADAKNLGLGSQRLRAETAALVGLTLVKSLSREV